MRLQQLLSLFRRRQFEHELDEEMQYHLDREIQQQIVNGLTPEEARRTALRVFNGIEQRK